MFDVTWLLIVTRMLKGTAHHLFTQHKEVKIRASDISWRGDERLFFMETSLDAIDECCSVLWSHTVSLRSSSDVVWCSGNDGRGLGVKAEYDEGGAFSAALFKRTRLRSQATLHLTGSGPSELTGLFLLCVSSRR